jgi:hypothetical protein
MKSTLNKNQHKPELCTKGKEYYNIQKLILIVKLQGLLTCKFETMCLRDICLLKKA